MSLAAETSAPRTDRQRVEELGRIVLAYSEVTEKLQVSHDQLLQTVGNLQQELSEKNKALERKNRLAALGEMAAGLAHEIRNPLGGIQLYASLLKKDVEDRPASHQIVEKIAGGVRRLEGLVSQVLQFSRDITAQRADCDLAQLVAQTLGLAAPKLTGVDVRVDGPEALRVSADPLLLGQALLNLLLNAAEAMQSQGRLSVEYGPAGQETFFLAVSDSGPGIEPAVAERIFNPFFSTKESGTGLGLAIVHRIVEAHDGAIGVAKGPLGGARFELTM